MKRSNSMSTENLYKEYYEFQHITAKAVKEQQAAWGNMVYLEEELNIAKSEYNNKQWEAEMLKIREDEILARIQELESTNNDD
jgi:hypothetical protein